MEPNAITNQMLLQWLATSFKDAGTTAGAQLHGPGGLLGTPGLNRTIVNATIMPRGLAGRLPVRKSVDTNAIYPILTGLTASTGAEPTAACADWPMVGQFKACHQVLPFGQQGRQSQVLNVKYAGQITNRGEFRDNVLLGQPVSNEVAPGPINWQRALQTEYEKKIAELFAGYHRDYARNVYGANPANTSASAGYQEFIGLDKQINTGKRDAISGIACPAIDSLVIDMNGASINTDGAAVYATIANAVNNLERLAEQLGMEVEFAIAIRFGAWQVLSSVWPCVYATTGCGVNTIIRTQSLEEATRMRDDMRNGRYLMIEGKRYEVIVDDAIAETVPGAPGTYESDIYFVPLRVNGQPSLYWEYFDMNAEAIAAANRMAPGNYFSTLDDGRFLFVRNSPTHTCVNVEIIERPRLVLLTPFLAARFQNLRYTYAIHERDAIPGEPYFVNGGSPSTPKPYFYPNG